jgi:ferredoxin-type protein NapG
MDRGDFLKKLPFWLASQSMTAVDAKPVKHRQRPPGALPEPAFKATCTGCDACMAACPHNLIMIEDLERRDPIIYPDENPCLRCNGYPCIQACNVDALVLPSNGQPEIREI